MNEIGIRPKCNGEGAGIEEAAIGLEYEISSNENIKAQTSTNYKIYFDVKIRHREMPPPPRCENSRNEKKKTQSNTNN